MRTEAANADGRAEFFYLKPGEYYLRCFIDRNGDGVWTTGDYDAGLQPEETFYFEVRVGSGLGSSRHTCHEPEARQDYQTEGRQAEGHQSPQQGTRSRHGTRIEETQSQQGISR